MMKMKHEATISFPDRIHELFAAVNLSSSTSTTTSPPRHRRTITEKQRESVLSWIPDYLSWHAKMRQEFPGYTIFTHPNAPKTAVSFGYPGMPSGLNDRFKSIGHLLRLAHDEQRVLFLKWFDCPMDLEEFLVPNLFNWTLPEHAQYPTNSNYTMFMNHTIGMTVKGVTLLSRQVEDKKHPIRLRPFVQTGSPLTGAYDEPFHLYWDVFFQPSALVKSMTERSMKELGLVPFQYDALHMRVGHPAFRNTRKYGSSDGHLDRHGENKLEANPVLCMNSAVRAIQCAQWLAYTAANETGDDDTNSTSNAQKLQRPENDNRNELKIFFFSDSPDLMSVVMDPNLFVPVSHSKDTAEEQEQAREELVGVSSNNTKAGGTSVNVVARLNTRSTHIGGNDKPQSGTVSIVEGFADTFVDLYIGMQARCFNLGVGNYGYLAAKIGGTSCWAQHSNVRYGVAAKWGMLRLLKGVPKCPLV